MSDYLENMKQIRNSAAMKANKDSEVAAAVHSQGAEIFVIDVLFPALKDEAERDYLNQQPTSFVLPDEAIDRLRKAAGQRGSSLWIYPIFIAYF